MGIGFAAALSVSSAPVDTVDTGGVSVELPVDAHPAAKATATPSNAILIKFVIPVFILSLASMQGCCPGPLIDWTPRFYVLPASLGPVDEIIAANVP